MTRLALCAIALSTTFIFSGHASAASLLFDCSFPTHTVQRTANDTPRVSSVDGVFRLKYFYDAAGWKLSTLDMDATWPVQFMRGIEAMTILQDINPGGNISTVVIVLEGADKGRAIYNRMTMLAGGMLVPSQYYGRCEYTGLVPLPTSR
jgi:hypothetical protein